MTFDQHPAEKWIPVRFLRQAVVCSFCRCTVWAGSPGHTTGTRGTRVWWNQWRNEYECMPCRSEAVRAGIAFDVEQDHLRRAAVAGITAAAPQLPLGSASVSLAREGEPDHAAQREDAA